MFLEPKDLMPLGTDKIWSAKKQLNDLNEGCVNLLMKLFIS